MTLTNPKIQRREFLRTALATAGGVAAMPALGGLGSLVSHGRVYAAPGKGGYGPLVPTADLRDGGVRIALPEGFQYRSFSAAGDMMSDGNLVPLAHDGMGVFNMSDGNSAWSAITRIATAPAPARSPSTPMPTTARAGAPQRSSSIRSRASWSATSSASAGRR